MIRYYCDLCNKEIIDLENDLLILNEKDFPFATYIDSSRFFDKNLCIDCYYKRLGMHMKLDEKLFNK